MKLVKIEAQPLLPPAISAEAEEQRNALVLAAIEIQSITTAEANETAREAAVGIRNYLKTVEAARATLTKPLLNAQRQLKSLADDHVAPLTGELGRLERLATVFIVEEEAKAAAERQAMHELVQEAKTPADFAVLAKETPPEAARAHGQTLRQVLCYEVTDIVALFNAKPDCVKMLPCAAMIQELCVVGDGTPGIRTWWENRATYSTR